MRFWVVSIEYCGLGSVIPTLLRVLRISFCIKCYGIGSVIPAQHRMLRIRICNPLIVYRVLRIRI